MQPGDLWPSVEKTNDLYVRRVPFIFFSTAVNRRRFVWQLPRHYSGCRSVNQMTHLVDYRWKRGTTPSRQNAGRCGTGVSKTPSVLWGQKVAISDGLNKLVLNSRPELVCQVFKRHNAAAIRLFQKQLLCFCPWDNTASEIMHTCCPLSNISTFDKHVKPYDRRCQGRVVPWDVSIVSAENIQMFKKLLKHMDFSYTLFGKAWY